MAGLTEALPCDVNLPDGTVGLKPRRDRNALTDQPEQVLTEIWQRPNHVAPHMEAGFPVAATSRRRLRSFASRVPGRARQTPVGVVVERLPSHARVLVQPVRRDAHPHPVLHHLLPAADKVVFLLHVSRRHAGLERPPCVCPRHGRGPRGQRAHSRTVGTTPNDVRGATGVHGRENSGRRFGECGWWIEEPGARGWAERRKTTRATRGSPPGFAPWTCYILSLDPLRTFPPRPPPPRSSPSSVRETRHTPALLSAQSRLNTAPRNVPRRARFARWVLWRRWSNPANGNRVLHLPS